MITNGYFGVEWICGMESVCLCKFMMMGDKDGALKQKESRHHAYKLNETKVEHKT